LTRKDTEQPESIEPVQPAETESASPNRHSTSFALEPDDAQRLANLCGHFDSHIEQIADHFELEIYNRGNKFTIEGKVKLAQRAALLIQRLYRETANGTPITPDLIHLLLQEDGSEQAAGRKAKSDYDSRTIKTPQAIIKPRGPHQPTCSACVNLISTSAWARPVPVKPSSPLPPPSKRCSVTK